MEEFLLESFPNNKNLRLFAENFVMTNDKYLKKPQSEKGGVHGMFFSPRERDSTVFAMGRK